VRNYSLIDQVCLKTDQFLRVLGGAQSPSIRPNPAEAMEAPRLSKAEEKHVAGLMRVNYAGEVCAQALYQGQALMSTNMNIRYQLEKAGLEEEDHLYWCQSRLQELNSHVSLLNPFWYAGSFLLGAIAGKWGDAWSLGFLEETEKQVVIHLEDHLQKLPSNDHKTRKILETMRDEEAQHAETAHHAGAKTLPGFIKTAMRFSAKIMTKTAYWV